MFIAAIWVKAPNCKQSECLSTSEWMYRSWTIHIWEFHMVMKIKCLYVATWMNLTNIMLNKIIQMQKICGIGLENEVQEIDKLLCKWLCDKTIKKSKQVVRILDTIIRIVFTFLEEIRNRDWTEFKGGFLRCWVLNCAYEYFTFWQIIGIQFSIL